MPQILGSSVSCRIAVGPQQGRKAFMICTIRPATRGNDLGTTAQARLNGAAIRIDIEVYSRCGGSVGVIADASDR